MPEKERTLTGIATHRMTISISTIVQALMVVFVGWMATFVWTINDRTTKLEQNMIDNGKARITALETARDGIVENVKEIKADVKEIRSLLLEYIGR